MSRPARLLPALTMLLLLSPLACEEGGGRKTHNPEEATASTDPFDATARRFLASLGEGDYGDTVGRSGPPLSGELTKAEYDELTEVVAGLGAIQQIEAKEKKPVAGGQYRRYMVQFEKGLVEYEVTIEYQMVVGFHLEGPGFDTARSGVIADKYRNFEVYEFEWRLEDGTENPDGEIYSSPRIDWQLLVGGLKAADGGYHLGIAVGLLDEDGKQLFKKPIAYDVDFGTNPQGVPTGNVDGHLEAPGPGSYTLQIHIQDKVAGAGIDHTEDFVVEAD